MRIRKMLEEANLSSVKESLSLHDVFLARKIIYQYLDKTPLKFYQSLSDLVGAEIWVKHENHHSLGAFKVRGGLYLASMLSEKEKRAGLFTASTGNHGQSIAFAAKTFGTTATIAVPEKANPAKVAAMQNLGGTVLFHGPNYDVARRWIRQMADEKGGIFVGPTETALICGVGTYVLEIYEDLPDVDTIIVPVGGGSSAAAACTVSKAINPDVEVIGAQSSGAPAAYLGWKEKKPMEAKMQTFAEGVATTVSFDNTREIMARHLDDFLMVDDSEIENAIILYLKLIHNLAEGAGAIPLAAALKHRSRFEGKKVVLVLSGGNLFMEKLRTIIAKQRMRN